MSTGQFFPGFDPDDEYNDLIRAHARDKARFCLATGIAPSEYEELTMIEIEEFSKEVNKRNGRKG